MRASTTLSPASVLVAAEQHVSSRLGDGAVMLGIETGFYYRLNSSSMRIWELLQKPRPLSEVLAELQRVYNVEPGTLRQDTERVIEAMLAHHVLKLVTAG